MPWTRNNSLGFAHQSLFPPAAEVHGGKLWLMFVDVNNKQIKYGKGDNEKFESIQSFSVRGQTPTAGPALCDVAGTLHAVFPGNCGESRHQ